MVAASHFSSWLEAITIGKLPFDRTSRSLDIHTTAVHSGYSF
ncbi:hypothetical protein SSAG_05004 [Streptomyces sp. Mg1]|nr:hypothetical protein SSAG_05004 [Streptomyces sp. Mg1]